MAGSATQKLSAPPARETTLPPVFFLHIHKTAGTSLRHFLEQRFPAGTALMDVHHAGHETSDLTGYRLVHGHVGFGFTRRFARFPFIITYLRDPVERAISSYYYYRSRDEDYLRSAEQGHSAGYAAINVELVRAMKRYDLGEFLEREPALAEHALGNYQTRFLLGDNPMTLDPPRLGEALGTDALPEAARHNLERCAVVGITERADDALPLLCHGLGWSLMPGMGHVNRSERPRSQDLPAPVLARLVKMTRVDALLYAHGVRLLEDRLARLAQQPNSWSGLPDAKDYSVEQGLHGQGWYVREWVGGSWHAWSGPERTAWLDLGLRTTGNHRLRCHFRYAIRKDLLAGLQLQVNGQFLSWKRPPLWRRPLLLPWQRGNGGTIEALVPADLLRASPGRVRIEFTLPEVVRAGDARLLGVALRRIQMTPVREA